MTPLQIYVSTQNEAPIRQLFDAQQQHQAAGALFQFQRSKRSLALANNSEIALYIGLQLTPNASSEALAEYLWQTFCNRGKNAVMIENQAIADLPTLQDVLRQTMQSTWPQSGIELQRLKLPEFGSLHDFEIEFSNYALDDDGTWQRVTTHAIVGTHAEDQTSLFAAILRIFQDTPAQRPSPFAFDLAYRLHGHQVSIKAERGELAQLAINGMPSNPEQLAIQRLLPSRIFVQGDNDRHDLRNLLADTSFASPSNTDGIAQPNRLFYCHGEARAEFLSACLQSQHPPFLALMALIGIDASAQTSMANLCEEQAKILSMAAGLMGLMGNIDTDGTPDANADSASLFLLYQPESGLHPGWQLHYTSAMDNATAATAAAAAATTICAQAQSSAQSLPGFPGQIIMASHSPLMINHLRREQVRIVNRHANECRTRMPHEHPQGMGVAGLLKSEMFGLPSTLDQPTQAKLQQRNALLAKQVQTGLNAQEAAQLQCLRERLDKLGFAHENRDALYQLFLEKMHAARQLPLDQLLSPEELAAQTRLAEQITRQLLAQEQGEKMAALANDVLANADLANDVLANDLRALGGE